MTDLRERVAEILTSTDIAAPDAIAERVIESSTAQQRREWMPELLAPYVADVIRFERNRSHVAQRPSSARSAKRDGIRSWWQTFVSQRICVDGVWMAVGSMTAHDAEIAAAERRRQAAELEAKAEAFDRLAKVLADHGVDSVAGLPESARAEVEAVFQ
ncbi:hypothetical protein [Tsukamurella tyrosinosolvens]|uniref:hypothetical protein n=1 Tax=Tsukamurella tyrosinosolvens TaxID=57704 RepID=UPI00346189FB